MPTRLEKPLKRELAIEQTPYTLVISPTGLHLAPKGRRKGIELRWLDLVNGEAALAVALNASLASVQRFPVRAKATAAARTDMVTPARAETPRRVTQVSTRPASSKTSPARKKK
jgi:hypothetical protein